MNQEHIEEYLGAIYRLRESPNAQLPLSRLQEYLMHTPISIHEMIQKLEKKSLVNYVPYRGVTLTKSGEHLAAAIVRRHRIWECFLTESLMVSWDQAHEIAGRLEHAAPEIVTERLSDILEGPQQCPHGNLIPTTKTPLLKKEFEGLGDSKVPSVRLDLANPGRLLQIIYISPEIPDYLRKMKRWGIRPGEPINVNGREPGFIKISVENSVIEIPEQIAQTIWVCDHE